MKMSHAVKKYLMIILIMMGVIFLGLSSFALANEDQTTEIMSETNSANHINTNELNSLDDFSMWVDENQDAGLNGKVVVSFTKSSQYYPSSTSYSGTLYLPGGADVSQLYLNWDTGATVKVNNITQTSGTVQVPINDQSQSYKVTVGSNSATFKVQTMISASEVQGLFLSIDESRGTIDAMNTDTEHETKCFGSITLGDINCFMSMKGRGNWTWKGVKNGKKPYNITLHKDSTYDKKESKELVETVSSKQWSLLANYSDGSLLRNKIAYDLADALEIGLKSRFVDVYMNGEYLGNYLLTPKTDYQAPKKGYFLELDNKLDESNNPDPQIALEGLVLTDNKEFTNMITVKDIGDKAIINDQAVTVEDIQAWMQEMLNAVMDEDSEDYLNYIDLDSWAKFYLLHETYKSYDILSGSMFMYRKGLTENDKLIAGPIWDMDNSMGRSQLSDYNGVDKSIQNSADAWYIENIVVDSSHISFLQYLGKHESFMERVYEIYNENQDLFNALPSNVDTLKTKINDSASMNFKRWNINQTVYNVTKYDYYTPNRTNVGSGNYQITYNLTNTWSDYTNNLKLYLQKRTAFMSDQLAVNAPEKGTISGTCTVEVGEQIILAANCTGDTYQWQYSSDGKTWTNFEDQQTQSFTKTMDTSMDGLSIRCVVANTKEVNTERVAKADSAAKTVLDPVICHVLLMGDADGDGEVTTEDAQLAKKIAMKDGTIQVTDTILKVCDFDHSGHVTINEVRKIQRTANGIIQ